MGINGTGEDVNSTWSTRDCNCKVYVSFECTAVSHHRLNADDAISDNSKKNNDEVYLRYCSGSSCMAAMYALKMSAAPVPGKPSVI